VIELFGRLFAHPRVRPHSKAAGHRPALEALESRYALAAVYNWSAPFNGLWNDPNNWQGGPAGTYPGAADDVIFNGTSLADCEVTVATVVAGMSMASFYSTGQLKLSAPLTLAGSSQLYGGTINQPNGDNSKLTILSGTLTVDGTTINDSANLSTVGVGPQGALRFENGPNQSVGSTIDSYGTVTFSSTMTADVSFTNNAGFINESRGSVLFDGKYGITTSGTGVFTNKGDATKTVTNAGFTTNVDLPIVNDDPGARLIVQGNLRFSKPGPQTGVSVQVNAGEVDLYTDRILSIPYGYNQNLGYLKVLGAAGTAYMPNAGLGQVGMVIHGGYVFLSADGNNHTLVTGQTFTIDGGNLVVLVDGTSLAHDEIIAGQNITLGTAATLSVTTQNVPAGGVAAGQKVEILSSGSGSVSGDFGSFNWFGFTWFTEIDGSRNQYYELVAPFGAG
jgi:hypothetical protein